MTLPTFTPIWDGPFPTEGPGQSWTSHLCIGDDPYVRLYVKYEPAEYPTVPYRYEVTVAGNYSIYAGGVTTLSQAQRNVRDAAIRHLEQLLAQARVLMPDDYLPQVRPLEPEPLDPERMRASYVTKALEHMVATGRGEEPCRVSENLGLWMALCEQMQSPWREVGGSAFAPPFGTIRQCLDCGSLVAGGPTQCGRCAALEE